MKTKYKSIKGILQGLNIKFVKESREGKSYTAQELSIMFAELLKKANSMESVAIAKIEQWKGKSSVSLIEKPDKFIIVTYQKPEKGAEPEEVRTEIEKEELNLLIESINYLSQIYGDKKIPTTEIARQFCVKMGFEKNHKKELLFINGKFNWSNFFAWRGRHNAITRMLGMLDYFQMIEYKGGKTRILQKPLDIQTCLSY